jgi:hypothetical protein
MAGTTLWEARPSGLLWANIASYPWEDCLGIAGEVSDDSVLYDLNVTLEASIQLD